MYQNYSPKQIDKLVREIQVKGGVEKRKKLSWYSYVLIFVDICAVFCFLLAYGPYSGFRDWLVTTALSTGGHKYFAYVLYSQDMVKKVVSANTTTQGEKFSNVDDIEFTQMSMKNRYCRKKKAMIYIRYLE